MKSTELLLQYRVEAVHGHENTPRGVYTVPHPSIKDYWFLCAVRMDDAWEHVSAELYRIVSHSKRRSRPAGRCLTWKETCFIKNHFWGPQEVVLQFMPAMTDYIGKREEEEMPVHLWNPLIPMAMPSSIIDYGLGAMEYFRKLKEKFPEETDQDLYDVVYYLRGKLHLAEFYTEAEKILHPKSSM